MLYPDHIIFHIRQGAYDVHSNLGLGIAVQVNQTEPDLGHGLTWQFTFAVLSKLSMPRITC